MFTIIGGDGREYGPATVEQIRAWIAAGRANLETKAKAVGTEEWRRLGDFAEFSPAGAVAPPVMPAAYASAAAPDFELSDPWTRLGAWFIDKILAFASALPGMLLVGFSVISNLLLHPGTMPTDVTGRTLAGAVLLFVGGTALLIVQLWLLTTRGQTIGKRILGVRIVTLPDNSNPGFVRAVLLRLFVPGLITFVLNFMMLGFVFFVVDSCFIFRADRRCIHDLIANTRVVRVPAARS